MNQTLEGKFPDIISKHAYDDCTDSSGISLSDKTLSSDSTGLMAKDRLQEIANRHNFSRGSVKVKTFNSPTDDRYFTPSLPRIDGKPTTTEKGEIMKCDYRLSSLPKTPSHLPAVPRTVAKYRHRVKVIPVLNLPSPDPPCPPSPPPAARVLLREQYIRERNQQSPGFTEADLERIFDHYSISRYLASRDNVSRLETTRPSPSRSTCFVTKKSLPSIHDTRKAARAQKPSKLKWIPRLAAWIPEEQFGAGVNITVKPQPICCQFHDFYHKNLNWDVRDWMPSVCPRYSLHHHHHKQHRGKLRIPSLLKNSKNQGKQPTVPRDPFTSKSERNIKRPWLKAQKPSQEKSPSINVQAPGVHLVLPNESDDVYPYHWMVDTATMTDESISDIFNTSPSAPFAASHSTPSLKSNPSDVTSNPVQIKKKEKLAMVDKACDVMSISSLSSRRHSLMTEDTDVKDVIDDVADTSSVSIPDINIENEEPVEVAPKSPTPVTTVPAVIESPLQAASPPPLSPTPMEVEISIELDPVYEEVTSDDDVEDMAPSSDVKITEEVKQDDEKEEEDFETIAEVLDMPQEIDLHSTIDDSADSTTDSYQAVIGSLSDASTKYLSSRSSSPVVKTRPKSPLQPRPLPKISQTPIEPAVDSGISTLRSDDDDSSDVTITSSKKRPAIVIPLPTFLERPSSAKSSKSSRSIISIHTPSPTLSQKSARRRGKVVRDTAMSEEMRRAQRAEERRRRANEKFEKVKQSRLVPPTVSELTQVDAIEDDEFLGNITIFNPKKMKFFRRTFDTMDIDDDGFLDCEEVMEAVHRVVPSDALSESHIDHIYRLLELADYDLIAGKADFKLFSIIAALAQRIVALDDFMRGLIDRFDFQSLDSKMWRARQLFKHYVDDHERQTMSLDSLWVELKAGGLTQRHENQIRESMKHLPHLDVLDFMTYLPLFTLTHSHVISNPLCDERII